MYQLHTATDWPSWQRLVSESFVPLEASPVSGGGFRGSVGGGTVADVGLMRIDVAPQRVERTPARIAEAGNGYYKLSFQLTGTGLLAQDGHETVLRPGDLALYDTQRPYTITYEEEFSALVLMFPQPMLVLPTPDVAEWIRRRRLEKCRRDLADPLQADTPVAAIGARWGLADAGHFSRAFRAAYGASPAAYRKSLQAPAV